MLKFNKIYDLFKSNSFQFWLLFILIILLRFWPFFQGKTLVFGDNYSLLVPVRLFTADWLKQGVLPLWNPLNFAGIPWLGDINPLYPGIWSFVIFPPALALNLTVIGHLLISYAGMYLLAKAWLKKHAWAIISAVFWMLSTQITGSALVVIFWFTSSSATTSAVVVCPSRTVTVFGWLSAAHSLWC